MAATPDVELEPGKSFVIGREDLARMYGKSDWWARCLLRTWWKEQQTGGPVVTFRRPRAQGHSYFTTINALARVMPPARDMALVRKVAALEKDLDFAMNRIKDLETRIRMLERR